MDINDDPLAAYYFQPQPEEICGMKVPSITEQFVADYSSVVDRFFTRYYYIRPSANEGDFEPYSVLFHSNRICLISVAPEHPVFHDGNGIKSISFDIGNSDRSQNKVTGKGKKGGMALQHDSTLAIITANNGNQYKVPSCIRGKLIEVNDRVLKDLRLAEKEGDGYLAIVLPKPEHCEELKRSLLTTEQYQDEISKRTGGGTNVLNE